MDQKLLELEELGFPMLADWIHENEIMDLQSAMNHLKENRDMMDDADDRRAFKRAEEIIREIFETN